MRKAVNNMFSFREYLRKSKVNEFEGDEYLRSFIPDKVYKYFSFPKMDSIREEVKIEEEIQKRMTQLEEGKVWLSKRANLNDPFELSCICGNLSDEAKQYVDEVCETREILCLTTSPLNKLMWAHYADSYMGYCIEFSTNGNFPSYYLPEAQIKGMIPVEYIKEKQDYSHEIEQFVRAKNEGATNSQSDEDKFMSLFSKLSKCPLVLRAVEAMFVYKDAPFSYENELRFITYPADDENLSRTTKSKASLTVEFLLPIRASKLSRRHIRQKRQFRIMYLRTVPPSKASNENLPKILMPQLKFVYMRNCRKAFIFRRLSEITRPTGQSLSTKER